MSNNEPKNSKPESSALYPLIILSGVILSIGSFVTNFQAIYAALGLSVSMILIGVGVLGWFVNQQKISFQDGVQYSIIWTLLILLAGGGYFVIINRPASLSGSLVDNNLDRNPVRGYQIELYSHQSGNTSVVRTDAEGKFTFDDMKGGEYDLIINGVIVRSEEARAGLRRLMEGNISAGRFYLDNLGVGVAQADTPTPTVVVDIATDTVTPTVTSTSTQTALPTQTETSTSTPTNTATPTQTEIPTVTLTRTPRPTNTPRPPTATPTQIPDGTVLIDVDFEDNSLDGLMMNHMGGSWRIVID